MTEQVGVLGRGRFGSLLIEMLSSDFEVLVFDKHSGAAPGETDNSLEEVLRCGTIFYAVPISEFETALQEHRPFFEADSGPKVLIDVLSVKLHPREVFERLLPKHVQALLTHPMFGPDSVASMGLPGQTIVLDQFTLEFERYQFWRKYFTGKGLTVVELAADEHDRLAAWSQGLTHFIGRVLDEMGMEPTPIDTVGARKLREIRQQTCNDSWQLFMDLQGLNPHTVPMRVALGAAVDRVYSRLLPNRIDSAELVVGIQGGRGSFNEEAARYYLKRSGTTAYRLEYLYTTENVLQALHEGRVDRGQFAVHNSLGGVVQETIEAMSRRRFHIVEQFSIKIAHALMIRKDARLDEVERVMTHPQVLKQCRGSLSQKYSRLELTSGTGDLIDHANVAARLGSGGLPKNVATMGSRILAELHDLQIVEDNLQDLDQNFTSFLWVERP